MQNYSLHSLGPDQSAKDGMGLLRRWFESLADAGGKVQRQAWRFKVKAGFAELQAVFDDQAVRNIGKALTLLEADRITFGEFAAAAMLVGEPQGSFKPARRAPAFSGQGDTEDPDDPIGLKSASELATLLQVWHTDIAGGAGGYVTLKRWTSRLLSSKGLEEMRAVGNEEHIRQVSRSFATLAERYS